MLFNVSRNKLNQTVKSGKLMEDNTRNIFLEKSYTNRRGETRPRPFSKNENFRYTLV